MANNIVVLGFENEYGAEAMLDEVHKWQEEGLIEVEDAVIASAAPDGKVEIQQTHRSEGGKFALRGGGVGLVAGALLGGPILGLVAGVTAGAITSSGRWGKQGTDTAWAFRSMPRIFTPLEREGSLSRKPLSARAWRCSETVLVLLIPNRSPISRMEG